MKLAFAGKGGVGKTTLCAWAGDWLARNGHDVWMVDADTALSLGQASGLEPADLPEPLVQRRDIIRERIGSGILNLNPLVDDLPGRLAVELPLGGAAPAGKSTGSKKLLVMGTITAAGGGCACKANALLKAMLRHLVLETGGWVLVDLEAGVEHMGRGTVAHVDGLIVVSEPSLRGLQTASGICRLAKDLGLSRQALVLNRAPRNAEIPPLPDLPDVCTGIPLLPGLAQRQLTSSSVLNLPEQDEVDELMRCMLGAMYAELHGEQNEESKKTSRPRP
jgi:CO dehydrogenase maturation factor